MLVDTAHLLILGSFFVKSAHHTRENTVDAFGNFTTKNSFGVTWSIDNLKFILTEVSNTMIIDVAKYISQQFKIRECDVSR